MQDLNQENKALREELSRLKAEMEAIGAGGVESLRKASCLHQIQEPAVNQQLTTEQEPVTWLLRRSAFRASPDGQDAEGHEWLEEADEPGQESSFPVYAAPVLAAQPAKSLMKRVDAAAEAMSEVMAHVNLGAWSVKFERALAGLRAVQETEPQAAPAAVAVPDAVIAGALFDFCGYLTTLPKESAITASGFHDASPMVDALKAWAEKRRLELDEADVPGWTAALEQKQCVEICEPVQAAVDAPVAVGERTDLYPGVMRCAKCEFQLVRAVLSVQSGQIHAGDSKTEPCPNGCGPLWPVTYKEYAKQAMDSTDAMADRAIAAEKEVETLRAALAATPEAASSGYQCADCKAPLRAGYTCDKCDSSAAEEVEATAPAPMVLPEPVTWLVKCSQSVKLPNESNAEDCEWLEEADEQGMEGSFAVYTEQQVRDLLATGGQAQELADTVQTVFNALQDKIDARGPISKGNLQYYVNLLREAFDAAPQAQADARDAAFEAVRLW